MADDKATPPEKPKVQTTLYLETDLFDRYQSVFAKLRQKRRDAGEKGRLRVHDLYVRALESEIAELEKEAGVAPQEGHAAPEPQRSRRPRERP